MFELYELESHDDEGTWIYEMGMFSDFKKLFLDSNT